MGKTEAQAVFAEMSTQIRKGTFSHPKHGRAVADPTGQSVDQRLTLNDVVEEYKMRHVWKPGRRLKGGKIMEYNLAAAQRVEVPGPNGRTTRLGEKILAEITKADLEAARGPLTTGSQAQRAVTSARIGFCDSSGTCSIGPSSKATLTTARSSASACRS